MGKSGWFPFGGGAGEGGKLTPLQWLILILCVGVGVMLVSNTLAIEKDTPPEPMARDAPAAAPGGGEPQTIKQLEEHYESQLREMLELVMGVSDVSVMVSLETSPEQVVQVNRDNRQQVIEEEDSRGGTRKTTDTTQRDQVVVVNQGSGEKPVVIKTRQPKVRGVLVVARGVENAQVKRWIVEAVQRVLDVPAHRISVLPKKP
ncbi:stage III sporulation protein AG [Calditerricola satsumensis]|uniref:Stage III sporulation protein AG n=2 Tax=Calditerricola satsumensis TaxID=373054 RepID=A0A8J3BFC6_9BACI|nr:stage III sporulation protein AG [Calditerricola satsumensis]GGJ99853.1 stage III sporulation protein AG [Calditerricola satsumensis]